MCAVGGGHAAKEIQHEDGHKLCQHGADETLLLGREFVKTQAVLEGFSHFVGGGVFGLGSAKRVHRINIKFVI